MAIISDLGVTGNGILQPKLKNRWRVTFYNIGGLGATTGEGLTVQAVTADRPKFSFEEVVLDRYNSKAYVAAKHIFEPVNITFEDDVGGKVVKALQKQLELTQRVIGNNSAPRLPAAIGGAVYKFSFATEMLDGNETVLEKWVHEGAFIQNIDYGDLDYAASEAVRITATIRFDHARQIISGIGINATGGAGPDALGAATTIIGNI